MISMIFSGVFGHIFAASDIAGKRAQKKEAVLYDGLSPHRKHPVAFCPIVHCFLLLARSAFLQFHSVKAFFCSSVSRASMDLFSSSNFALRSSRLIALL